MKNTGLHHSNNIALRVIILNAFFCFGLLAGASVLDRRGSAVVAESRAYPVLCRNTASAGSCPWVMNQSASERSDISDIGLVSVRILPVSGGALLFAEYRAAGSGLRILRVFCMPESEAEPEAQPSPKGMPIEI